MWISDNSLKSSQPLYPLQSGITLYTISYNGTVNTHGINCEFIDNNNNYILDKGDKFIVKNAEKGDGFHLSWQCTGGFYYDYRFE